jgi:hypothetical protein
MAADEAMNETDKLQAYAELLKASLEKFNKTRDIQWKLNLALWTLMGALAGLLYGKWSPSWAEAILALMAFSVVYFFFWAHPIQTSLEQDREQFSKYRNRIEQLAGEENPTPITYAQPRFKWPLITSALTIFFRNGSVDFTLSRQRSNFNS